jgi:hypothetical protein
LRRITEDLLEVSFQVSGGGRRSKVRYRKHPPLILLDPAGVSETYPESTFPSSCRGKNDGRGIVPDRTEDIVPYEVSTEIRIGTSIQW